MSTSGFQTTARPHSLHHLTDTHFPAEEGRLARYVDRIAALSAAERPDLIVHSGDLVDGGADEAELRAQLAGARALLERAAGAGVPYRCLCHSHDRFGEPVEIMGRAFAEVIGQPFVQHLSLPHLEIYLLSGGISASLEYRPATATEPPPSWGYDIYHPHVRALLERFVDAHPGRGGRRVLFTHHPIVPFRDLTETGHPDARFIRPYHVIGDDSRPQVLACLKRLGFTHVFGGHCHLATRNEVEGIQFLTAPSFLTHRHHIEGTYSVGHGVLTWTETSLDYRIEWVN